MHYGVEPEASYGIDRWPLKVRQVKDEMSRWHKTLKMACDACEQQDRNKTEIFFA
jgi:hypothetical protein